MRAFNKHRCYASGIMAWTGDYGYLYEKIGYYKGRRGWVLQHRVVIAEHLGRPLTSEEHVHHIDNNPANNAIGNLALVNRREHYLINKIVQFIKDPRDVVKTGEMVKVKVLEIDIARKRISLSMKQNSDSLEVKRPRSKPKSAAKTITPAQGSLANALAKALNK